jgi:hypothetical protein
MAKEPYINIFIGDLLRDTAALSLQAFGAFHKLLYALHLSATKGKVTYSLQEFSRLVGADDFAQASEVLKEIIGLNICDCEQENGKYTFISRRMIKEADIKEKRRQAGKISGKNSWMHSQKEFARTNEPTKDEQITGNGNGIGIGNDNDNNEGVIGETKEELQSMTTAGQVYLVPAMLNIWRTTDPSYPIDRDRDFKPLQEIAEFLAKQNNVQLKAGTGIDPEGFLSVVDTWKMLAPFIGKHRLFKSYSLQQMSRHIQSIIQAYRQNENDSTSTNNGRKEWHGKGASISEIQAHKYNPGTVPKDEAELCGAPNYSLADDWE